MIKAKIVEIRNDVIRYRYCDPKMKNIYVVKRSFVSKVLVANGTIDVLKEINNNTGNEVLKNSQPRTHGSAVASMILGIVAAVCCLMFLPSLLFSGGITSTLIPAVVIYAVPAILAIIFGLKAYRKINEEPGKHKGMNMAKAGLIMGGIYILIALIAIILLLIH
jgi:hypothetical protein